MASRRTGILVATAVLCVAQLTSATSPAEAPQAPQAAQARLGGLTDACRTTRGLPGPCSVACSMSARLCRACCAALATFTTVSTVSSSTVSSNAANSNLSPQDVGPLPSDEDILTKGIAKSANCLALCSSFPAKKIREMLKDPKTNEDDLKKLVEQMTALNAELPWSTILENANSRPWSISVLCENGKLTC